MALSAVDNALWDLRGKILDQPVYNIIGNVNREQLEVYSRVGEGKDLKEARRIARERYDKGQKHQKWYFVYGPKDGQTDRKMSFRTRILRPESEILIPPDEPGLGPDLAHTKIERIDL